MNKRGAIITIMGDSGIGKTSLACTADPSKKILLLSIEDGAFSISNYKNVVISDIIENYNNLISILATLQTQKVEFNTIVIDSITQLDTIIEDKVLASDPKRPTSINNALGGFGAGHASVAFHHKKLRDACSVLARKNINIIFIGHSIIETIEPADADPYTRYNLRLNKKSCSHYVDNVDLVAYIKLEAYNVGNKSKRAVSSGDRSIICYTSPSYPSKNRFGISEPLPFTLGSNPLTKYINTL